MTTQTETPVEETNCFYCITSPEHAPLTWQAMHDICRVCDVFGELAHAEPEQGQEAADPDLIEWMQSWTDEVNDDTVDDGHDEQVMYDDLRHGG